MKFVITIPASLSQGKKPKVIPAKVFIADKFNEEQVRRNESVARMIADGATVQPLDKWIESIPTI